MPGQDPILGEQLDLLDVTSDISEIPAASQSLATGIANDSTAINTIATGIANDPTASGSISVGVDHLSIQNIGTNSHAAIDTHISDTTIHFTTLTGLSDVNAVTPNDSEVLTWDNGTSKWIPEIRVENPMVANLDTAGFSFFTKPTTVNLPSDTITLQTGDVSFGSGGVNAGDINLYGGNASNLNFAGDIKIYAGASSFGAGGYGGTVAIAGGIGTAGTTGGNVDLFGGNSTANVGGNVNIAGGESGVTTGTGAGHVNITGGENKNISVSNVAAGNVNITGGATASANGQSGNINVRPGGSATTAAGNINFYAPSANSDEASIRLWSESGTAGYVALKAPVLTGSPIVNRTWILPQDDPTTAAGFFLQTDTNGVLSFSPVSTDLINDTSPQLGGDLDVNDFNIISRDTTINSTGYAISIIAGASNRIIGGGNGGEINIIGGYGSQVGSPPVTNNGGDVIIQAGDSYRNGGDLRLYGGDTKGGNSVTSGDIRIKSGGGTGTTAGTISLQPGTATGSAGLLTLIGAAGSNSTDSGDIKITAGSAHRILNATGGSIILTPGAQSVAGSSSLTPGNIDIHSGEFRVDQASIRLWNDTDANHTTGNYIELKVPATTTNRTWLLPDDDPIVADGQVLTTDSTGILSFVDYYNPLDISADTTVNRTFVLADAGNMITMNNASANTVTIPDNASVAFAIGTEIVVSQFGSGQTTFISAGSPPLVTINSTSNQVSLAEQYSTATLIKVATDTWLLTGDLV